MKSFLEMLERQRFIVAGVIVIALLLTPLLIKYRLISPTYVGQSELLLVNGGEGKQSLISSNDMGDVATGAVVLGRVHDRFHIQESIADFRALIQAKVTLRSNTMPILYRDKDRVLARDVPNAIADETVAYYKELATKQYDEVSAYLRGEMGRQEKSISKINGQLQDAAQRDTDVGSASALESITTRLNDLSTQRAQAYATYVADRATAVAQASQSKEVAGIVREQVLTNDSHVQALRQGLGKDATALDVAKAQYTSNFPGLPSLEEQVKLEGKSLNTAEATALKRPPTSSAIYGSVLLDRRRAEAVAAGDKAKLDAIDTSLKAQQKHLADLPSLGVAVDALRVKRDAAQAAYSQLATRLALTQAGKAEAASLGSIVVIDRAAEAYPRIPQFALALIIVLGILIVAVMGAYLIDLADPRARARQELERIYGGRAIGNIG